MTRLHKINILKHISLQFSTFLCHSHSSHFLSAQLFSLDFFLALGFETRCAWFTIVSCIMSIGDLGLGYSLTADGRWEQLVRGAHFSPFIRLAVLPSHLLHFFCSVFGRDYRYSSLPWDHFLSIFFALFFLHYYYLVRFRRAVVERKNAVENSMLNAYCSGFDGWLDHQLNSFALDRRRDARAHRFQCPTSCIYSIISDRAYIYINKKNYMYIYEP